MLNDLALELTRSKGAACGAFKGIENVVERTESTKLRAYLCDSTGYPVSQVREEIQNSNLRQRSKMKDAVLYAKQSKIRWAGLVVRMNDNRWTTAVSDWIPRNVKRTTGGLPTRWSEFFTKSLEERYDARRLRRACRVHWATLARYAEKWKIYWRALELLDDQRDYR
ncbi:unnamed protein product [Angiostrongylus costaricensis]|uniref:Transposase n=1 Tax=Angiostrongylus costaricensis TaxID=334426 RepID=A0A0R3PHN3_ANGCS|nr:unnamed protein product [Angiostrongylus costaricensis]